MKRFEEFIAEGPNDPSIFKAVFLAGGPGSGKSFVVGKSALASLGFRLINSDGAFEAGLARAKLTMNPEDIASAQGQAVRASAKALTGKILNLSLSGRLGLVIDGTGKDYAKIKTQVDDLRSIGYSVHMIFVNTDLETAIARNNNRPRSLPDDLVSKMWKDVQKNIGKFQGLFRDRIIIVDNSEGSNIETSTTDAYKKIKAWAAKPPENSIAVKWIRMAQAAKQSVTEADLSMDRGSIIDFILADVKAKLMKDVFKSDLTDLKQIASIVKKKVEIDFKHKGRLRIKD